MHSLVTQCITRTRRQIEAWRSNGLSCGMCEALEYVRKVAQINYLCICQIGLSCSSRRELDSTHTRGPGCLQPGFTVFYHEAHIGGNIHRARSMQEQMWFWLPLPYLISAEDLVAKEAGESGHVQPV